MANGVVEREDVNASLIALFDIRHELRRIRIHDGEEEEEQEQEEQRKFSEEERRLPRR